MQPPVCITGMGCAAAGAATAQAATRLPHPAPSPLLPNLCHVCFLLQIEDAAGNLVPDCEIMLLAHDGV